MNRTTARSTVILSSLALCAALAAGCGALEDGEELVDAAGLEGLADDKADTAGGSYVRVLGAIALGSTKTFTPKSAYQGHTFTVRSAAGAASGCARRPARGGFRPRKVKVTRSA